MSVHVIIHTIDGDTTTLSLTKIPVYVGGLRFGGSPIAVEACTACLLYRIVFLRFSLVFFTISLFLGCGTVVLSFANVCRSNRIIHTSVIMNPNMGVRN